GASRAASPAAATNEARTSAAQKGENAADKDARGGKGKGKSGDKNATPADKTDDDANDE
ncbi:MAG: hypothetical protein H0U43_09445, partial [Chthoniobacterales bacterium]|nr:hypothetical protein [Chthoniobacterales bacterium]